MTFDTQFNNEVSPIVSVDLLDNLIDYAGMFPPAALPLDEAIRHYAGHRCSKYPAVLSGFVSTAEGLSEFANRWAHAKIDVDTVDVSVVAQRSETGFSVALATALRQIYEVVSKNPKINAQCLEIPLPTGNPAEWCRVLADALRIMLETEGTPPSVAIEVSLTAISGENHLIESLATLIAQHNLLYPKLCVAIKFRCGGASKKDYPSCEALAQAIACCGRTKVPLKFTAGLHHFIRGEYTDDRVKMHGLINVMFATFLAYQETEANPEELRAILLEEEAGAFKRDADTIRWRDRSLAIDLAVQARNSSRVKIGSCDFIEPCEELDAAGWLQATSPQGDCTHA